MQQLKDYQFGYADAAKEYSRIPKIFENAFYDKNGTINELLCGYNFLLIGSKGSGKSAYSAKIQSLAKKNYKGKPFHACPIMLDEFDFPTFNKTKFDKNLSGGKKFLESWKFLLFVAIYRYLYTKLDYQDDVTANAMDYLTKIGIDIDGDLKLDTFKLSKLKISGCCGPFGASIEGNRGIDSTVNYKDKLNFANSFLLKNLNKIFVNEKILFIIDGLDDILRYKKEQLDILSSLIRSIDYINDKMVRNGKGIKILLLIRTDLISLLTDPDLNKIIQDGAIKLNWNNDIKGLKSIVNLRFMNSNQDTTITKKSHDYWADVFPPRIRSKDSCDYILDHTLLKPRDILQFLKECQRLYPDKERLTIGDVTNCLKEYSSNYFMGEMKNELTGLVSDDIIFTLPAVLKKISSSKFNIETIKNKFKEEPSSGNINDNDIKLLLLKLFEAGYIGQVIPPMPGKKFRGSINFKYRNPATRIDYKQNFITHKGLIVGLGVRI